MRDIKFRAWDVFNGEMLPDKVADDLLVKFFRDVNERRFGGNEVIIMQFTGLLDKNGKEMYESDIVSSPHFKSAAGISYTLKHIVQWSDKYHGWFLLNCTSMDESDGSIQLFVAKNGELEVIGNIYENPELLNK